MPQFRAQRFHLFAVFTTILLGGVFLTLHYLREPIRANSTTTPVKAAAVLAKREAALPPPEIVRTDNTRALSSPIPSRSSNARFHTEKAVQLWELSGPILRQRVAAQQRLDAYAANSGDFKGVIPAQAKRYQEAEAVLTLARLLRDPQWSPLFLTYVQHRHGLEYIRKWLHGVETSLEMDAGFSSARDAHELEALLQRAEVPFQKRSDEIAAKFQLDAAVAADAREVAMLNTLQAFVEAYRYWTVNKNREE